MSYDTIIYEKATTEHIAKITLNRPEKLNAAIQTTYAEIAAAINDVEQDDDIKVVILRGAGRAFCVGQDLTEAGFMYGFEEPRHGETSRRPSQRRRLAVDRRWCENLSRIFYCSKATIAQVHGYCLGSGFDMALSCDLLVASDDAKFGHPGRRLVGPAMGFDTMLWLWRLGTMLTKDLMLTGRLMDASEAERRGVLSRVVPKDKLEEEANSLARTIALMPSDGIVMGKTGFGLLFDILGMRAGFSYGQIAHSFGTNIRYEPEEHNFFKERRDKGAKAAFHERDARFSDAINEIPEE